MNCTLILGGARSGKSAWAERLAAASGKQVVYIATAQAGDGEMAARIDHHRERRPASWTTVEEPLALGDAILRWSAPDRLVLVDCLTLWLSNLMFCGEADLPDVGRIDLPPRFELEHTRFLKALAHAPGEVLLVSNEVGMGIVPFGAVTRRFADEAGRLNQATAAIAGRVVMLAAGLPLVLKGAPC
ncbi:MAG: bifunctional adenosylcobinamide kinase/adenosylcobinamide-phosphate guanylyltransferase [Massilia sp.]